MKKLPAACGSVFCLLMASCSHTHEEAKIQTISHEAVEKCLATLDQWINNNPCGALKMKYPVFNVSGFVTAEVKPGSYVYLHTAHNTTLEGAIYAANHCHAITRAAINKNKTFSINSLPAGTYVLSVPIDSFGSSQGFPLLAEFNRSGHSLEIAFQGRDYRHSLGAFTIRPIS